MNHYRTVSWWLTWEDLDFPNSGIVKKMRARARACHEAGVEMVIIFGCHFRWDFVCCFDTVHALIRCVVEACHEYGIKVIDHHSATLTHRPRAWDGREQTFMRNHHHVPFTPDREVAAYLQYNGTFLNAWRERRADDGEPGFVTAYQAELFCTNNPDFIAAYSNYVARLFRETGIDGVMSDDVGHYSHWAGCGCTFCRQAFRARTGHTLPEANDWNFWGNFDNPEFRRWVRLRHESGRDFLTAVRQAIPRDALLTSCCSGSIDKSRDPGAMDMAIWHSALNMLMLEMCGSLASSGSRGMAGRAADIALQHSIARTGGLPVLGLGYAYYPDEAFLIWSFDRFFNNDVWISSHKTRLGIDGAEQQKLPDEPVMVAEAFNYEKKYADIFEVEDMNAVALYYSSASRSFNGDAHEDYARGMIELARELYGANVAFTVVCEVPDPARTAWLVVNDADCLDDAELLALDAYRAQGGHVILCGLFGNRDASGDDRKTPALARCGITQRRPEIARGVLNFRDFFEPWGWDVHRAIPTRVEFSGAAGVPVEDGVYRLDERLYWRPERMHGDAERTGLRRWLETRLPPPPVTVEAPRGVLHKLYRAVNNGYVIHFMPTDWSVVPHEYLRFQGQGARITREIHYAPLSGSVTLQGNFREAELYSPDCPAVRPLVVKDGRTVAELASLKRFFSIRLR